MGRRAAGRRRARPGPATTRLDDAAIASAFAEGFHGRVWPGWEREGDLVAAGREAERFLPRAPSVAGRFPGQTAVAGVLSPTFSRINVGQRAAGDPAAAERTADRFVSLAWDLAGRSPGEAAFAEMLAEAYVQKSKNAWQSDDLDGVATWLRRAVAESGRAVDLEPDHAAYRTKICASGSASRRACPPGDGPWAGSRGDRPAGRPGARLGRN